MDKLITSHYVIVQMRARQYGFNGTHCWHTRHSSCFWWGNLLQFVSYWWLPLRYKYPLGIITYGYQSTESPYSPLKQIHEDIQEQLSKHKSIKGTVQLSHMCKHTKSSNRSKRWNGSSLHQEQERGSMSIVSLLCLHFSLSR